MMVCAASSRINEPRHRAAVAHLRPFQVGLQSADTIKLLLEGAAVGASGDNR
jgi:hypothetical protein